MLLAAGPRPTKPGATHRVKVLHGKRVETQSKNRQHCVPQEVSRVTAFLQWRLAGKAQGTIRFLSHCSHTLSCNGALVSGCRVWNTVSLATRLLQIRLVPSPSCCSLASLCCGTGSHLRARPSRCSHRQQSWRAARRPARRYVDRSIICTGSGSLPGTRRDPTCQGTHDWGNPGPHSWGSSWRA